MISEKLVNDNKIKKTTKIANNESMDMKTNQILKV